MDTPFTRLVGCPVPIQQAPMGAVSSPELAVAVADAGGVGTITALFMPAEHLDAMLADMAAKTRGVLAANFLTNELDRDAVAVAARRVRLVDFFWADPDPSLVEIVHDDGALASWQVGSVTEARAAVDAGCDVIIAQGTEAGGHIRGQQPLLTVLREVLEAVDVPVLAAGGIADAKAFAGVLAEGAAGARIGTRFIATNESGAHPAYKQAVVDASRGSTEITDAFAVCPLCATSPRARVLRSCIESVRNADAEVVGETVMAGEKVPIPRGSGMPPGVTASGDVSAMALYAGESVDGVHDIAPVAQVIESLGALVPR